MWSSRAVGGMSAGAAAATPASASTPAAANERMRNASRSPAPLHAQGGFDQHALARAERRHAEARDAAGVEERRHRAQPVAHAVFAVEHGEHAERPARG